MLPCNFGEIVGRSAHSDVVYVCPIMEKKKKKKQAREKFYSCSIEKTRDNTVWAPLHSFEGWLIDT